MSAVRILVQETQEHDSLFGVVGIAWIKSPFEAKDAIKQLPIRKWDSTKKLWVIPASGVTYAEALLELYGFSVEIGYDKKFKAKASGSTGSGSGSKAPQRAKDAQTWADTMFAEIPAQLSAKVYSALSKVLHPDVGGDLTAMQQLNVARDRQKVRTGSGS